MRRGLRLLQLHCFVVFVALIAQSGASYSQTPGGVIKGIVVEGNQRIEASTIRSYMVVQPGDVYDPEDIDLTLKTLFATGLFADVVLFQRGPNLVVRVVENPIINRVVFEHNKALDDDKLEEEVQLKPRIVYTRAKVQVDVQKIIELYRRSGRFAATVNPKVVQLPQNRVDLIFEISEGDKTGVKKINFIGNKKFSDGDLKDVMVTAESRWWKFLESNDNYDPDRLAFDREQLRKFYLSKGYADFKVISAVAELTRDRSAFFITITVEEGERYKFGKASITTTLQDLNKEALLKLVNFKEGDWYNADKIDDVVESITFVAGASGYAFVDVRPRLTRDVENRIIDVEFQIIEGPRVYVERININGNVRTLDRVIRREIRLVEGDAYNKILVDRSKARVRGLGYFKDVEITEEQGSAPDKTIINVKVEEQSTGELSIGAGFSSTDSFITDFSISERNLLGKGQSLRLRLQISGRRQQIDLSFTEPYFLGRRLAAGIDLFKNSTNFGSNSGGIFGGNTGTGFRTNSIGFGLRTGFAVTRNTSLSLRYTLRSDKIEVNRTFCDSGLISIRICDQLGTFVNSSLGATYSIDKRNDPILPTRGWTATISEDVAGLAGDVRYFRTEASAATYYGIWTDVVASFTLRGGYIKGWGGKDVRLNDRFFRGGNSFRGFKFAGLGPRDLVTRDALGGNLYGLGTIELSFPTGLPEEFGIKGALFLDAGTLGHLDKSALGPNIVDNLSLRSSAGVSIFWDSPFGPVRLDFAHILRKESFDETETFRFSAGTRF